MREPNAHIAIQEQHRYDGYNSACYNHICWSWDSAHEHNTRDLKRNIETKNGQFSMAFTYYLCTQKVHYSILHCASNFFLSFCHTHTHIFLSHIHTLLVPFFLCFIPALYQPVDIIHLRANAVFTFAHDSKTDFGQICLVFISQKMTEETKNARSDIKHGKEKEKPLLQIKKSNFG